jgi:hypothetical protein
VPFVLLAAGAAALGAARAAQRRRHADVGKLTLAQRLAQPSYGLVFYVARTVVPQAS